MMAEGVPKRIKSVEIYHSGYILGFQFFDKDHTLIWKIGGTNPAHEVSTVVLAENEVLVGVAAKLFPGGNSIYTNFQFQITNRWD